MNNQMEFVFPPEVLEKMRNNPNKKAQMEVELIISHEENGKQIVDDCIYPHSFVKAFIWILGVQFRNSAADATILNTSDVAKTVQHTGSIVNFYSVEAENLDTMGIQVGTGTASIAMTNNKLETKIVHGSDASELEYGACTVSQAVIDGSDAYFTISRQFTNTSGAEITIRELGLACNCYDGAGASIFLVDRTLYEKVLADLASTVLTYKIKVSI